MEIYEFAGIALFFACLFAFVEYREMQSIASVKIASNNVARCAVREACRLYYTQTKNGVNARTARSNIRAMVKDEFGIGGLDNQAVARKAIADAYLVLAIEETTASAKG